MSHEMDDSSSSSEDEVITVDEMKVQELEDKILANPYDYGAHVELLNLLDKCGDVDRCRQVRERMSGLFPLSPEMWLAWIHQERLFLPLDPARVRDTLRGLYARAVADYSSVRLWCQYCTDVTSVLEYSEDKTREVFEQALSDVGLHLSKGGEVWEQYRQYEEALLQTIKDKLSAEDCSEREFLQDLHNKQRSRVDNLYQRQLAVPLSGLEFVMSEYKTWLGDEGAVSQHLTTRYEAALQKREKLQPYEQALEITAAPHEDEYAHYIEHVRKEGDPARVISLMERALTDNPLNSDRWVGYLQYLDQVLKVKKVVLSAYARAVRNVPWVVTIWTQYMLAQQRYNLHFSHIDETLEEALKNGFQDGASYVTLWKCYLGCHWRQERFSPLHTNGADAHVENNPLNEAFQRAINSINQSFGEEGDLSGELTCFMAECEGERDDLESMRLLMSGLFESRIYKEQSSLWLEYINLELRYGDVLEARKIFQKAVQCSTDYPEIIIQKFLNFEAIHGTMETFDSATLKCRRQQKKIDEKNAKEAERQAQLKKPAESKGKGKQNSKENTINSKNKNDPKQTTKSSSKKRKLSSDPSTPQENKRLSDKPSPEKSSFPRKSDSTEVDKSKYPLTVFVSNLSYDATEDDLNNTFKSVGDIVDIRLVKSVNNKSRGFGYIEFHTREEVMDALQMDRVLVLGRPCYVSECKEKSVDNKPEFKYRMALESHKLFVNNLPYTTTEGELRELFGKIATVKSLRMVTTKSGKFKGFAYIEYSDAESAKKAIMELNGKSMGERTMSVAISNPPSKSAAPKHNDSSLMTEKADEATKRKMKMNFMIPRAVTNRKPKTGISGSNPAASDSNNNAKSADINTNPPSNDSEEDSKKAPKQMLSNSDFSKLFQS